MSATTSGALKAHIEGLGLNMPAYRDRPPAEAAYPHVTIHEAIVITRERSGDQGDPNAHRAVTELAQVDLWQKVGAESYTLPEALIAGIDGAQLPTAPQRVYGCTVDSMTRLLEIETQLVHHAITVRLRRDL